MAESYKGKVAVAKVILNRVNANGFPNTITGVIYEPIKRGYAFTPVTDGRINQPASAEAKMAIEKRLSLQMESPVIGFIFIIQKLQQTNGLRHVKQ